MPRSPRATISGVGGGGDRRRGRRAADARLDLGDDAGPVADHLAQGDDVGRARGRTTGRRTRRRPRRRPRPARGPRRSGRTSAAARTTGARPGDPAVRPPLSTSATTRRRRVAVDQQRDAAVAEDDAIAGVDVVEQRRVVDRDRRRRVLGPVPGTKPHRRSPGAGRRRPRGTRRPGSSGPGRSASTPTGRPTRPATVADRSQPARGARRSGRG